jgi:uncharacterized protein HemX
MMNPEWFLVVLSIVAGAVVYGFQLRQTVLLTREVRELKNAVNAITGEHGLDKRVEQIEERLNIQPRRKSLSAASGR